MIRLDSLCSDFQDIEHGRKAGGGQTAGEGIPGSTSVFPNHSGDGLGSRGETSGRGGAALATDAVVLDRRCGANCWRYIDSAASVLIQLFGSEPEYSEQQWPWVWLSH